jgi:hypothetical protein
MFYVYEHWRPDQETPFYVGKGKGRRANLLNNRNDHHKAIQKKLGNLGLAVEVKIVAYGLTEKEAFSIEIQRIAMWRSLGVVLANKTKGGEGESHKDQAKIKVSMARKGKPLSKEHREKLSLAKRGKKQSPETVKIRSEKLKGNKWNKGKFLSDDTKRKLSDIMSGNQFASGSVRSQEHKNAISKAHKGKEISESTRLKMSKAASEREERKRNAALFS